jgi:hypothetical protein
MNKERNRTPEIVYNEAISQLIIIKKRRIEDGESNKRVNAAQKAIDDMIKKRDAYRTAVKFTKWRARNA